MRYEKTLLRAGIVVPIAYFANLFVSSRFYPGYSHKTQFASELGSASAPYPRIFNITTIFLGLAAIASGVGFFSSAKRLTGKPVLSVVNGLFVVLFGIGMMFGGLFPMPDPRHGGFGMGMGIHLAPLLLVWAFRGRSGMRGVNIFLIVTFILMTVFLVIMMGVGGFVTRSNVGIFQRVYALVSFAWIGVASYRLMELPQECRVPPA